MVQTERTEEGTETEGVARLPALQPAPTVRQIKPSELVSVTRAKANKALYVWRVLPGL